MTRRYFGSARHSDGIYRSCSRCGRELTDSASRECGVGPVCRRKDNAIFARQIPANLTLALTTVLDFTADNFHAEIAGNFESVRAEFVRKTEAARREHGADQMPAIPGGDFRDTVDWLDMSLSYRTSTQHRLRVINLIDELGYVSLASVLRGEACMSPATLEIEGERVLLKGKSNKAGWKAMKQSFGSNVKTPRYRGDSTPYSVHVSKAEKFVELALKHWPFMKNFEEVDSLLEQTREAAGTCDPEDTLVEARIVEDGVDIRVSVPWTGTKEQMMRMIGMFKEIPRQDRTFVPSTKTWVFKKKHVDHVTWAVARTGMFRIVFVTA